MRRIVGLVLTGMLLFFGKATQATPIVDQQNLGNPACFAPGACNTFNAGAVFFNYQQGITAGATGLLTRVDILLGGAGTFALGGSIAVSIYLGAPWQTDTPAITVPFAWNGTGPGFFAIDVSSGGVFVTPGALFSIGIVGLNPSGSPFGFNPTILVSGFGPDAYTGGGFFASTNPVSLGGGPADLIFRTWVDPALVPEPATPLLLGTGLAMAGVMRRRRRKNRNN